MLIAAWFVMAIRWKLMFLNRWTDEGMSVHPHDAILLGSNEELTFDHLDDTPRQYDVCEKLVPNVTYIIWFHLYETFKNITPVAEKRSLVAGVIVGERTWHEGGFWDGGTVLYLECGGCINLYTYTTNSKSCIFPQKSQFYCMMIKTRKKRLKR